MGLTMSANGAAQETVGGHRSWNSAVPSTVIFTNCSPHAVRVVWLSHSGFRKQYNVLPPGESYRQPTFCAHPWTFEAVAEDGMTWTTSSRRTRQPLPNVLLVAGDTHQRVFYAPAVARGQRPPVVYIQECAFVTWSPEQHKHFPAAFRAEAQALLLAHHRLVSADDSSSVSSASSIHDSSISTSSSSSSLYSASEEGQAPRTAQKSVNRLLRRLGCCSKTARSVDVRDVTQAGAAAPGVVNLSWLPHDIVLAIIATAAPALPLIKKPPLPHGVPAGAISQDLRGALFVE